MSKPHFFEGGGFNLAHSLCRNTVLRSQLMQCLSAIAFGIHGKPAGLHNVTAAIV
jgi:hypothetical protein